MPEIILSSQTHQMAAIKGGGGKLQGGYALLLFIVSCELSPLRS